MMWNGAEMKPFRECQVKMINHQNGQKYAIKSVVLHEDFHSLFSASAIQKIALITVNNDKFRMVARVSQLDKFSSLHPDEILSEFNTCCSGNTCSY